MSNKSFKELTSHIIDPKQLLYIFSSSQLILIYFTLFYTLYKFNLYTLILLLVLLTKTLFLYPIKKLVQKSRLGKRPKGAFNCNQYNCGGVPESGGFPSGHMLGIGIFIMVILNNYQLNSRQNPMILYLIAVITTAIGRYYLNCHTVFQIVSGLLLGLIIGYILYLIDNYIETKIEIYRKHKVIFYQDLDRITEDIG